MDETDESFILVSAFGASLDSLLSNKLYAS